MESKQTIRHRLLKRRKDLSNVEVATASGLITATALANIDWASAKLLHIYSSLPNWKEIGTTDLIESLERLHPGLTIDTSSSTADAPQPGRLYDVIIVPVLGFDSRGYRLGLGKGWYDRFLATQPQAQIIGLAYSWAHCDNLPIEPHDIPLGSIITEKDVLSFG